MTRAPLLPIAAAALAVAALAAGPDSGPEPSGEPIVIPAVAREVEGNSDNLFPFNGDPMRYQQVIASAEFPPGLRSITGIALRPDAAAGRAFDDELADVEICLSTSKRVPSNLSRTFAENVGEDETVVYRGRLPLSSAFAGPEAGPKAFDVVVRFQQPFHYDPAAGSLLLDVRNHSGGTTTQLDAQDAPDTTARVWSDEVDAEGSARPDPFPSVGLVIRFLEE